jgi:hypothetical protein
MKKIIALSIVVVSMAAPSVFGQGWMLLSTLKSQVYDGFTTAGTSALTGNPDVALLWAANNTANPFPVGNTLTTGSSTTLSTATGVGYTDAGAWSDIYPSGTILSGWTLALDAGEGDGQTAGTPVMLQTTSKGAVTWNGGSAFGVSGTSASQNIALILLSWNSAYSSPSAAEAAGSAIGWSYLSSFLTAASATDSVDLSSPTMANFGTFIPATTVIPEPATLALAGLSGLSLLFLRRKKA